MKHTTAFVNDLGNAVEMSVEKRPGSITVMARGPLSEVEHTWTVDEATELRNLLSRALLA